jgi:divalent metal cation (Fe/Co/Zn/Cd) transporter
MLCALLAGQARLFFGVHGNSKALIVTALYALHGAVLAIVHLLHERSSSRSGVARGKLAFLLVSAISPAVVLAVCGFGLIVAHCVLEHPQVPVHPVVAFVAVTSALVSWAVSRTVHRGGGEWHQAGPQGLLHPGRGGVVDLGAAAAVCAAALLSHDGHLYADTVVAVVLAALLCFWEFAALRESLKGLMDGSPDPALVRGLESGVDENVEPGAVQSLRVRQAGSHLAVSAVLALPAGTSIGEAEKQRRRVVETIGNRLDQPGEVLVAFRAAKE